MKADNENPLDLIFIKDTKGKATEEIKDIQKIPEFFKYLKNDKIDNSKKIFAIEEIIKKFKINRYIIEYFSKYENKSIYIFLFDIYLKKETSKELKDSIINLLNELRINIETGKEIYEYLFQKLSRLYRGEEDLKPNNLKNYLTLLYTILDETDNCVKPRNYFSCNGTGRFILDCNDQICVGYSFTIIMNFKVSKSSEEDLNISRISNLITLNFSNSTSITVDLKYPNFLIIKEIKDDFIKQLPNEEWINLLITFDFSNKTLKISIHVNGENNNSNYTINQKNPLKPTDTIESVELFNKFYGEVSSMTMFTQKEPGKPGVMNKDFLMLFNGFKGGLWKKKSMEKFIDILNRFSSIDKGQEIEKVLKPSISKKNIKNDDKKKYLIDNLLFVFTPFNCYNTQLIEDYFGRYQLILNGDIKNHRYQCYQKKISLVCNLSNFLPIAEMFLIHPEVLNEENFEIFLKIINNIIRDRKENIKTIKQWKVFKILSVFIEKYPNHLFTEKILNVFFDIGKTLFKDDLESLCANYFKHILLNEKILSKYNENLQVIFWNTMYLFCQSDKSQIENFINMNRLCLILRFYDKNKFTEMCCEEHLNVFKDQFVGSKKIMNPPMNKKLSYLKNIMDLIIVEQEPKKAVNLFKLLTLDLSPCLTRFILNIFISAFEKQFTNNIEWTRRIIRELLNSKIEVIISNTLLHSLPEIRLDIINFLYIIYQKLPVTSKKVFKKIENMIKTCLLPQKMFYENKIHLKQQNTENLNNNDDQKKEEESLVGVEKRRATKIVTKMFANKLVEKSKARGESDPKDGKKKPNNVEKKDDKKNIDTNKPVKQSANFKNLLSKFDKGKNTTTVNKNYIKKTTFNNLDKLNNNLKFNNEKMEKPQEKKEEKDIGMNRPKTIYPKTNKPSNVTKDNKQDNKPKIGQQKTQDIKKEEEKKTKNEVEEKVQILDKEVLVIKDEIYNNYLDSLFCIFLSWVYGDKLEKEFSKIQLDKGLLKYINGLELLSAFISELKDNKFTTKFYNIVKNIIFKVENAYALFNNESFMNSIIDISFNYYLLLNNKNEKNEENKKIYDLSKTFVINLFMNSLTYMESQININIFPLKRIETFLIWGNNLLSLDENIQIKEVIFEFLSDVLFELLGRFTSKNENQLSSITSTTNIKNNYYIQNYIIFLSKLYQFSLLFKLDSTINISGISFMTFSSKIDLPTVYLSSMRIGYNRGSKLKEYWMDYRFFDEIYKRVRYLWKMEKLFKGHDIKKIKKNEKYDYILNNIILVKEKKNIYQTELEFLCFELKEDNEIISSPFNIIMITLMSIVSIANNSKDENDMIYWLKEFKSFIKFVIIASSNMTKINQLEVYNNIENKCIEIIALGLSFLRNMIDSAIICKERISKYFYKILNFCIDIVYYQYNYNDRHKLGKKVFTFAAKAARNDLSKCAVFLLFTEYVKDKSGNILLSPQKSNIYLNQNDKIINLIKNKDWDDGLFQNQVLKSKINKNIFNFNSYEKIVKDRFKIIKEIKKDMSYKQIILELLPNYEEELLKNSNNSLEKNIKKKNQYKRFKIQCFSWRGYWSDRNMFFKEGGPNFKLKLINHYTKTFMKPILVPILDINYYLPAFSDFDTSKLFRDVDNNKNPNNFLINLDIDKILRLSEQNQLALKNIKKTFGQDKSNNISKENYLRNIYIKSNKDLAENLFQIANKLDFGKEEEFALIEKKDSSKRRSNKKYYLGCIVKTSHHIKGVCFIDDTKLNFKVFLNQKTGNAMSGVGIGFTNEDDDYDPDRQTCFGSYFVCHPKDKDLYKIALNYNEIKWIFRRRYYYKNSAMEIYTTTNKTFYFNFKFEKDREIVINEICSKLKEPTQIIDDLKETKDIFGNIIGFENTSVIFKKKKKKKEKVDKKIKLSKKIKDWKKWKITNFEFLMWLNIFSNRSYNDISQYPVFPWILSSYEDPLQVEQKKILNEARNESVATLDQSFVSLNTTLQDFNEGDETIIDYLYRDLSSPMGMLELSEEGIKRKELFMETYSTLKNENDEDNGIKPYIYGSNYSNPVYVCNYLMRLFPFTHISIELQGHGFDKPDRLFLSICNSFYNSTTQKTDVRELIPEFFYLPEMFLNINKLNMGNLQDGPEVNDVTTPCNNNPYDFIMIMKSVLENNKISYSIHGWIDLIFGSKVKGKEAELANNIFTEASYQENIDLNKIENKESYLRLVEFGLIPNQIMSKDCNKREKKAEVLKGKEITDQTSNLKTEKCKIHITSNNENENNKKSKNQKIEKKSELCILKIGNFCEEKITIILNTDYLIEKKLNKSALDKKTYTDETVTSIKFDKVCNRMFHYQYPNVYNDKTFQIFEEGKSMIIGGYYDGKILIINTEPKLQKTELIPFNEEIPVCIIAINKEEDYIFLGNIKGNIIVYKNDNEEKTLIPLYQINDQMNEISYIDCNNELNLWTSATVDGYINIYSLPLCKLFRCIRVPTKNCMFVFLSSSPLPSIIVITNDKKETEIFVYSINGFLILRQKEQGDISSPIIFKDLNSNDYLAYISNNNIFIRSLPNLILQVLIDDLNDIYTIFTNKNKTILYAANKSASEIYIIKHESKRNFIPNIGS